MHIELYIQVPVSCIYSSLYSSSYTDMTLVHNKLLEPQVR